MKNRILAVVVLLGIASAGCTTRGYVKAENLIGLVNAVCDRHDGYVRADGSLDEVKKSSYQDSSAILKKAFAEAIAAQGS